MTTAAHVRAQIRDAIVATVTGLTTTGSRVFPARTHPIEASTLPCLVVYATGESSQAVDFHPEPMLERTLSIDVVALASAVDAVDDVLDEIARQVEVAMADVEGSLYTIAKSVELVSTEIDLDLTSERPVGRMRLAYRCGYYTQSNAPDVAC